MCCEKILDVQEYNFKTTFGSNQDFNKGDVTDQYILQRYHKRKNKIDRYRKVELK
jgi:hypothetical protein